MPWHTKHSSRCTHTMNIVYNTHTNLELCSLYSIMLYIIQVHKYKSTDLNEIHLPQVQKQTLSILLTSYKILFHSPISCY